MYLGAPFDVTPQSAFAKLKIATRRHSCLQGPGQHCTMQLLARSAPCLGLVRKPVKRSVAARVLFEKPKPKAKPSAPAPPLPPPKSEDEHKQRLVSILNNLLYQPGPAAEPARLPQQPAHGQHGLQEDSETVYVFSYGSNLAFSTLANRGVGCPMRRQVGDLPAGPVVHGPPPGRADAATWQAALLSSCSSVTPAVCPHLPAALP